MGLYAPGVATRRNPDDRSIELPSGPLWLEQIVGIARVMAAAANGDSYQIIMNDWSLDSPDEIEELVRREVDSFPGDKLTRFEVQAGTSGLVISDYAQRLRISAPFLPGAVLAEEIRQQMAPRASFLRRLAYRGQPVGLASVRGLLLGLIPGAATALLFIPWVWSVTLGEHLDLTDFSGLFPAVFAGLGVDVFAMLLFMTWATRAAPMYVVKRKEAPPWWQRNKDGLVTNGIFFILGLITSWAVGKLSN